MNNTKPYLKNYDSENFNFIEVVALILFCVFMFIAIVSSFLAKREYKIPVPATLIESKLIHQDRELIGYTTTYHQSNAPVYDKPYIPDYYVGLYEYEHEGAVYKFYRKTRNESPAEIEVLLKSNNPEEFTISEDFLEFGEDVRKSTKPVIE